MDMDIDYKETAGIGQTNTEFLIFLNKVDILAKTGIILNIDKTHSYPRLTDLLAKQKKAD